MWICTSCFIFSFWFRMYLVTSKFFLQFCKAYLFTMLWNSPTLWHSNQQTSLLIWQFWSAVQFLLQSDFSKCFAANFNQASTGFFWQWSLVQLTGINVTAVNWITYCFIGKVWPVFLGLSLTESQSWLLNSSSHYSFDVCKYCKSSCEEHLFVAGLWWMEVFKIFGLLPNSNH